MTGHAGPAEKLMDKSLQQRKQLPHGIPSWVTDKAVFFVTICCKDKVRNQLCHDDVAKLIFESVEFRQEKKDWFVYLWLLMHDHMHVLVSLPVDKSMKQVIAKWKEYVAKRTGIRWQRDFFDHRLRSGESYVEKAAYIRMNPVRAGLVERPEDWKYVWEGSVLQEKSG